METTSEATLGETQTGATANEAAHTHSKARLQVLQTRAREAGHLLRRRAAALPDVWGRLNNREAFQERTRKARDLLRAPVERLPDVWGQLKSRPLVGVGVAVGSGLCLAALIGAAETAVALSAGVLAYQSMTRPSETSH